MSREAHVRICESAGVKFPRATRPLWVRVNLGFGTRTRQKLRLRGIDAPELGTRRGKAAKRFLEELLQSSPSVVLTTSRSDKYDRYLTDLYVGETYVNQRLLDEGLARLAHD